LSKKIGQKRNFWRKLYFGVNFILAKTLFWQKRCFGENKKWAFLRDLKNAYVEFNCLKIDH
jgi:hypothetical protein